MKKLIYVLSMIFAFTIAADESKEEVKGNIDSFIKDGIKKEKEKKKEKKKKEEKKEDKSEEKTTETTSENSSSQNNSSTESSYSGSSSSYKSYSEFPNVVSGFSLFIPENFVSAKKIFSINANYNFQYWNPNYIQNATIDTTTLNYFSFEANILNKLLYFKYETSFGGSPMEEQKKLMELREKNTNKWEKFLADFEFPYIIKDENWYLRFYFSYAKEIFSSKITLNENKYYISSNQNIDNYTEFNEGSIISGETIFQDFLLGMRFYGNQPSWILRLGLYYLTYDKPYSVTMGDIQLDKYVIDTTFSSFGVYGGVSFDYQNFLKFDFDLKVGSGSIYLIGLDMYIEDILEKEDMFLGYVETILGLSLYQTFYDFITLDGSFKMQYRNFYMSENESEEEENTEEESTKVDINTDLIFTFMLGLKIGF